MKPEDLTEEESRVAQRFRVICNEQIEDLEDKLPGITHPLEKDEMLKEIDALLDLVDQANERAVELVRIYNEEKNNGHEKT